MTWKSWCASNSHYITIVSIQRIMTPYNDFCTFIFMLQCNYNDHQLDILIWQVTVYNYIDGNHMLITCAPELYWLSQTEKGGALQGRMTALRRICPKISLITISIGPPHCKVPLEWLPFLFCPPAIFLFYSRSLLLTNGFPVRSFAACIYFLLLERIKLPNSPENSTTFVLVPKKTTSSTWSYPYYKALKHGNTVKWESTISSGCRHT